MSTAVTQTPDRALSIRIAANFTIDPIEEFLAYWMKTLGIASEIRIAPYNQVFQQLLEGGMLRTNSGGVNLVALDLDAWLPEGQIPEAYAELDHAVDDFLSLLASPAGGGAGGAVLVFPPAAMSDERTHAVLSAGVRILKECESIPGWSALDLRQAMKLYAVTEAHDPFTDELGNIPFTEDLYVVAATLAARWIRAACTKPKKVIALDCDQTLWQGIYGEGTMQVTAPYRKLQEFMIRQHDQGMLLTLVSKNNEADVLEALDSGSCVLRAEHCAARQVNWNSKAENLQALSDELGLALNTFIFVDDNPLECMEVRNRCPEVMTIQVPSNPEAIPAFLDHMWVFDRFSATEEDRSRSLMYAAERQRNELSKKALSTEEFLASLQIRTDFAHCEQQELARVAQLTHRTTQFNMSGALHSEQTLSSLLADGHHECWRVRVKDVFGDYGLVGAFLFDVVDRTLRLEVFLMSCRALGRRVEHQIIEKLKELALEKGADRIVIPVVPTARNRPAREFLANICGVSPDAPDPFECVLSATGDASEWRPTSAVEAEAAQKSAKLPIVTDEEGTLMQIANHMQSVAPILSKMRERKKSRPASVGPPVPPRNSLEETLATMWSDVLGVEPIGICDHFLELGGQSLQATRILARVRAELGVELSLTFFQDFFKNATVEALARIIEDVKGTQVPLKSPLIVADKKRHFGKLSIAQEALWYHHQLDPTSAAYNVPLVSRLCGSLDAIRLEKALFALVDRHELLRCVILTTRGEPVLVPLKKWRGSLQHADLRNLSRKDREPEAERLIRREAAMPFDLSRDPMLRCLLIRLADEEWLFLHNSPHIVTDGGSQLVFFRELSALYNALVDAKDAVLPELPFQFADFADWQRRLLEGEYLNSLTQYWKRQLEGAPPVELPFDFTRPVVHRFQGTRQFFEIPESLLATMNTFNRINQTTAYRCLYAIFNVFVHCYTGLADLCVGTPVAPMNPACHGSERVIGYFVNTLVLRMDLSGNPTFRELINRAEGVIRSAMTHSDMPLIKVAETLRLNRDVSRMPLFQINFRVLSQSAPALELKNVSAEPAAYVDNGTSKFDLALEIEPTTGKRCYFEYRTDLFLEESILQMQQDFQVLMEALLAMPDIPIANLEAALDIRHRLARR